MPKEKPHFPIILLPEFITTAHGTTPPPPRRPNEPRAPKLKRPHIGWILSPLGVVLLLMLVNIFVTYQLFDWLVGLLLLGAAPVVGYFGLYRPRQEWLQTRYEKDLSYYEQRLRDYKMALHLHEAKKAQHQSVENVREFRKTHIAQLAKKFTIKPAKLKREVQRGRSEEAFYTQLVKHFGKQVRNNVQLGKFEPAYVPDFCIIDDKSGLHIDIEIDEPYVSTTKQPIHFQGIDDDRNAFFLRSGWLVVRFAEEQIIKYPEACCFQIQNVLAYVLGDADRIQNSVPNVTHWTKQEATRMAEQNSRNYFSS